MQMLTQFPELWACGVAGVPFFDHIDAQADPAVRDDLIWWDIENCGDVVKDRARLEYYSPINHLDRVTAPLLLLAAARDPRCPTRQIDDGGRRRARRRHGLRGGHLPRRRPRDQRPRAPHRLRTAHRRLHPRARRTRLRRRRFAHRAAVLLRRAVAPRRAAAAPGRAAVNAIDNTFSGSRPGNSNGVRPRGGQGPADTPEFPEADHESFRHRKRHPPDPRAGPLVLREHARRHARERVETSSRSSS